MSLPDAYPRPAPLNQRIEVRGCCNCHVFNAKTSTCHLRPGPERTDPTSFCAEWRWFINTRVFWGSAFAPAEFNHPDQIKKEAVF